MLVLAGALLASPALAQEDDDLAPLTRKKPEAKPKPKPKPSKPPVKPSKPTTASDDDLAPLTPIRGELVIKLAATVTSHRAKVTIDDRDLGALPLGPQSLNTGEHTVTVRAPGFAHWTKKVTVTPNKSTELNVTLEGTAALVSVSSDVQGAEVVINGKGMGMAPIEDLEIAPGNATILVRKDGFRESVQTLKLVAGKEYPLSVKLSSPGATSALVADSDRPEVSGNLFPAANTETPISIETTVESTPVYKRWYFWAGGAAVVAAVAAGVFVGVSYSRAKPSEESVVCGAKGCSGCIGLGTCSGTGIVAW
jgi:hypothetical protein